MAYIVTDLTSMNNGNVCLACLDETTYSCIRPLGHTNDYQQESWYTERGICLGTKLDFKLSSKLCTNPHTEDANCTDLQVLGQLKDLEMQQLLEASCCDTIENGFGATPIVGEKYFSWDSTLPKLSIITLKVLPKNFSLQQSSFKPEQVRVDLTDENGFGLSWLPVTDLRYKKINEIKLRNLKQSVQNSKSIYIRLGLSRRYTSDNDRRKDGYWLQVNGIYMY